MYHMFYLIPVVLTTIVKSASFIELPFTAPRMKDRIKQVFY